MLPAVSRKRRHLVNIDPRPDRPKREAVEQGNHPGGRRPVEMALWSALALLLLCRAALTFVPTMWAWSLNLHRFLAPAPAWVPWSLAALSLVPAVARRLAPLLNRAGSWLADAPAASALAWGMGAALLVFAAPDHAQFVGDFIIRQSTLREHLNGQAWYPQALPLDLLIHEHVAGWLMAVFGLSPNGAGRLIGAVEVAMLGALATHLARVLELRQAAAFVAASIVFWGGYLTLFTGYNKAFSEICLLTVAVGVFGLDVARRGRGLQMLGIALAAALLIHRSALGLLPAGGVAGAIWLRTHGGRGAWRRPAFLVGCALPLVVLAVMAPRIVTIISHFDPRHFAPETARRGGFLAATFGGGRTIDMLNLLVMLSPFAILLPILSALVARPPGRERLVLGALGLPLVLVVPFIHPGQGYFRDWDCFVSAGVALSLATAWLGASAIRAAPRSPWLATALALGVAAPSLQWLLHGSDLDRGLARAEAFMNESPARTTKERYSTWEYLGVREVATERLDQSARAFEEASKVIPSPHILHEWAMVEVERNNFAGAREIYHRLIERNPQDVFAWWRLAGACAQLDDWEEAYRATQRVLALDPTHADAQRALEEMERRRPDLIRYSSTRAGVR